MGLTGKELIPVYFSLSQTYKDNAQYDLALKYFEEEFELEKDNAVEVRFRYLLNWMFRYSLFWFYCNLFRHVKLYLI